MSTEFPLVPNDEIQGCKPVGSSSPTAQINFLPWLLAGLLALLTVSLYWPATGFEFVNYDDNLYVTSNVQVQAGLTRESISWALLNPVADNWHPVTVLSHMFICQMFGLHPWAHHLANVLLHAVNAVLVFFWLRLMTGATWRSLMVAALFAVHPLHIQSVAWVAERKDVLSAFFGLLSLIFYVRHVQTANFRLPASGFPLPASVFNVPFSRYYLLALLCFAFGLMSKPMLVTWPFVMLLLDYWPLDRIRNSESSIRAFIKLVVEKIPFIALSILDAVVTFVVQKRGGSLGAEEFIPIGQRCGNALISYCRQLEKLFWPADLAVIYPYPGHLPIAKVLPAFGLLLAISVLFFLRHRRQPFLLMGWLWFCGMLVPVIGLVQTGMQAMADRHNYLPSLGVFIIVVWGLTELTRHWHFQTILLWVLSFAAILCCSLVTRQQLRYWQDSETLFRHAVAVTRNNYIAYGNLGEALGSKGKTDDAIHQFEEAIRIEPNYPVAENNLGIALGGKGNIDGAIRHFQAALRLKPDFAEAHYDLGVALNMRGQPDEAIREFEAALRIRPDFAEAQNNLGIALATLGRIDEAIPHFQAALRLKPDYEEARTNLIRALGIKAAPHAR